MIINIWHPKGGTGKATVATSLAIALSKSWGRTLYVELSPVPVSVNLGVEADRKKSTRTEATYVTPVIDPVSLVVAIALAYALERRLGGGWLVETYSDAWPQHVDILLYLKPLRGVVRIYTTTLSERAMAADRVVVNHTFKQEALGLKEYRGYPWCSPPAATPPGVEEEVEELVRTAVEAGGFLSLKYALEQFGQRAVARAIALGLLRYDPTTMSLKVTETAFGRD